MKLDAKTSEEKDHAVFGASSSERWLNCPASIGLIEKAPPAVESLYAKEGTAAHACLEFLLKNRKNLVAAVKAAREIYSEEMIEHALTATKWAIARAEELPGSKIYAEAKVDSAFFTTADQFGTLDIAIVQHFGRLVIADFKYGAGMVRNPEGDDGRGDPQLIYYALGEAARHDFNFADVELVVIQPRAFHESGETVRTFVLTIDALLAWVPIFQKGVERAKSANPPIAAGKWCRFCAAAPICPELKNAAMKRAQIVFDDISGDVETPVVGLATIPSLPQWLDACDKLEAWIEAVRKHAFWMLEKGADVPGYKLVQKRAQRKWKDSDAATKDALTFFGADALTEPKVLSPAQLEKLKSVTTSSAYGVFIKRHMIQESSGLTLAKDTDKRNEVKPIHKVFGVIEDKPKSNRRK